MYPAFKPKHGLLYYTLLTTGKDLQLKMYKYVGDDICYPVIIILFNILGVKISNTKWSRFGTGKVS